jgi:hypothetical protein
MRRVPKCLEARLGYCGSARVEQSQFKYVDVLFCTVVLLLFGLAIIAIATITIIFALRQLEFVGKAKVMVVDLLPHDPQQRLLIARKEQVVYPYDKNLLP